MKKIIFFILAFTSTTFYSFSQENSTKLPTRFLEIGYSANSYRGDLNPNFHQWTSAFHLGLKLNYKERLNGHVNFMAGSVVGQNHDFSFTDSRDPRPVNYFRTSILSLNYDLQFHIIKTPRFMLYLSQGIGAFRFIPRNEEGEDLSLKTNTRARNEEYANIALFFPSNIGAIYLFPNHFGAGFQIGFMNPTTDYIDNLSQLSNNQRKDNVMMAKFLFLIPLTYDH
ncbi:MAG: hypothetical protein ACK4ND_08135 [Cytophagaceae bacterium]